VVRPAASVSLGVVHETRQKLNKNPLNWVQLPTRAATGGKTPVVEGKK
jgi:hypothetical protein